MYVIRNAFDLFVIYLEPNDRVSRPCVGTTPENNHHRFTVHFRQCQFPRPRPPFVIEEIRSVGKLPGKPFGYIEASVGTNQFPDAVPIAAVKAFDVELHDPPQLWASTSSC